MVSWNPLPNTASHSFIISIIDPYITLFNII